MLNVSQLTNEVHKKLFSKEASFNRPDIASFNIGLLPQSILKEVLPEYITKESTKSFFLRKLPSIGQT